MTEKVNIISGDTKTPQEKTKLIEYPKNWQIKQHPESNRLTDDSINWMNQMKLLDSNEEKKVRMFNIDGYGGFSHPNGEYEKCLFTTLYITMWLYWDDKDIENSKKKLSDYQEIIKVLSGQDLKTNNKYANAWKDIIDKYKTITKLDVYQRLGKLMEQWIYYALKESNLTKEDIDNMEFEDFLNIRIVTIGMIPTALLLELTTNTDMTNYCNKPEIKELVRLSAVLVSIANELLSYPKDFTTSWTNLVGSYSRIYECEIETAIDKLIELNNESINKFDTIVNNLDNKTKQDLGLWIQNLRECVSGFSYWHTTAKRYLRKRLVINDNLITIKIVNSN